MQALEIQAERIVGPTFDPNRDGRVRYRNDWNQRQRDIDYYVIALHRFFKSVKANNTLIKNINVSKAITQFRNTVPEVIKLRDIAEHFDKYDWNEGNFREELDQGNAISYYYGPEDGGIDYHGKKMSVKKSLSAARALYKAVIDEMKKAGRTINLSEYPMIKHV